MDDRRYGGSGLLHVVAGYQNYQRGPAADAWYLRGVTGRHYLGGSVLQHWHDAPDRDGRLVQHPPRSQTFLYAVVHPVHSGVGPMRFGALAGDDGPGAPASRDRRG